MPAAPPESSSPLLRDLQEKFLRDLADRKGPAGERFASLFEDPPRGGFESRREVYRSGYLARITEAIENDFRTVRRILGEAPFTALIRRYIDAAPPRSFDLGAAGDRLPIFLADDRLADQLPFLYDLARLELAQARAFTARDSSPLAWDDLVRGGGEAAADAIIMMRPGTAIIHSAWPLDEIQGCRDLPDEQVSIDLEGQPVTLLIFRRAFEVRTRRIGRYETLLIAACEQGMTLASLPDALECGDDPAAVSRFINILHRLVGEGIFLTTGTSHDATSHQRKESP